MKIDADSLQLSLQRVYAPNCHYRPELLQRPSQSRTLELSMKETLIFRINYIRKSEYSAKPVDRTAVFVQSLIQFTFIIQETFPAN